MSPKDFVLEKYPNAYAAQQNRTQTESPQPWRWVIKPGDATGVAKELGAADSEEEAWAVARASLEPTSAEELPPEDLPAE